MEEGLYMRTYQKIAERCKSLPLEKQKQVLEIVDNMLDECAAENVHVASLPCPFCQSDNITKIGRKKSKQRYKCGNCITTFTSTTHTICENSHASKEQWRALIIDTMNGLSIDHTAESFELSHSTVFRMRHKFLLALEKYLAQDPVVLRVVSELDETYVSDSLKGTKFGPDAPRKPRLHGEKANKRGLSNEKICICTGVERNQGAAFASTINRASPSSEEIKQTFKGHIEPGTIAFTDGAKGYKVLEDSSDCIVESVDVNEQKKRKSANLNNVNSFHSFIKERYGKYRGVATKYLNRYNALFSTSFRNRNEMIERLCDTLLTPGPIDYSFSCKNVTGLDLLEL